METARCRAFLAAAETGSFSKAAEALSYTPSGVNQLVTALEKELGFPVFRRNTKGVTLTENGELLLPTVREFLLYYLTKPEHQLQVREEIYLDNMLDLF